MCIRDRYEPQEVPLNGRKQLKTILKETANELQEVTVVAYGTQKKETLTGAISAVSNDALVLSLIHILPLPDHSR